MSSTPSTGRRGWPLTWLALATGAAGLSLVVVGLVTQQEAAPELGGPIGALPGIGSGPSPAPGPIASPPPPGTAAPTVPVVEPADEQPLGPSEPVSIEIPAIDVASDVFAIGLADDGALAVPQPGPNLDKAAWFENSPTPGQPGPAVIEGHVATDEAGPSIFYDLADLRPGDRIKVSRDDGRVVVFTVDALREFDKSDFPTTLVYGGDGTPSLRLITCSAYDAVQGEHKGNLVVFASLDRVRPAPTHAASVD